MPQPDRPDGSWLLIWSPAGDPDAVHRQIFHGDAGRVTAETAACGNVDARQVATIQLAGYPSGEEVYRWPPAQPAG
jgi:hypothetical protein